jgi:3-deoxy-D-arabino-heptulosonate 7-phosphate (DAHP) synthase class II
MIGPDDMDAMRPGDPAHGDALDVPARYGRRRVPKMLREMNVLRHAIRAEGTPAIQDAWDAVEEHIDFAYRPVAAAEEVERLRDATRHALQSLDASLFTNAEHAAAKMLLRAALEPKP